MLRLPLETVGHVSNVPVGWARWKRAPRFRALSKMGCPAAPTSRRRPRTFTEARHGHLRAGTPLPQPARRCPWRAKEQRPWGSNAKPKSTAADHRSKIVSGNGLAPQYSDGDTRRVFGARF